jgi:hypothetical protein
LVLSTSVASLQGAFEPGSAQVSPCHEAFQASTYAERAFHLDGWQPAVAQPFSHLFDATLLWAQQERSLMQKSALHALKGTNDHPDQIF